MAAVGDVLQPSASTTVFSFRFVGPASFQSVEILPPGADSPARVYTIDGGSAWCRGEAKGTAPVGAEGMDAARRVLVQSRRRLLEIVLGTVPELAANGKVVMFTYAGLELDPDGKRQLVALDVADDAGSFGRLFFRTDTHLPARLVTRFMMTVGRAEMATRTLEFDDYRSVDGIMLPFSIARRGGGYRVTISHYTLNPDLPDGLFAAPTTPQGLRRIIDAMR